MHLFLLILVIPWDDANAKKAKDRIWHKLSGPVLLDSNSQVRDWPAFLGTHYIIL